MKRNWLRLALTLCLALTLTLQLMPTVWASEKGSKDNPYVYTGYDQGDFQGGFDTNTYLEVTAFGAFAQWVNDKLESTNELYVRIEANLLTTRQDENRLTITIGNGKTLHLELVGVRVGNEHSGVTSRHNPYFLVEPGGTLEITGQGTIQNEEVNSDDQSGEDIDYEEYLKNYAMILNYGTMKVTGSISLQREYNVNPSSAGRQHTVINYGNLTIVGGGEYTEIDVLSTAAGFYGGRFYVGNTNVKDVRIDMATVFVEESEIGTPTVQMENVLIYNGFGFVDSSNGPVDTGGPDQVGSFPLIKNGEMYYYHEAVNVPARVTLTDIVFKESANDSTDCYGILLLNSPSAEVILEGTQENLKPIIVGSQSGTTIYSLQNQTFASLTLTDVEESITISGATVELMKNGQAGYIKLNNCSDVTLENCTADALILTNGYLLDKNLAPNEIGKYGQNSGQDVGFLPDSQQQLSVQLDNCVMNTLYLYDNVVKEEDSKGKVDMAIDSGLYGFGQETVEKLFAAADKTEAAATYDGVQAQATITTADGEKPVYAFATNNEELLELIQKADPQQGDTVTIQQAEEGLELSGVVSGITVQNDSGTDIIANGSKLNAGQSVTIGDSESPSEQPDYDDDGNDNDNDNDYNSDDDDNDYNYDDDDDDDDDESETGPLFVKPNHADDADAALPSISVKKPETATATETETKDFYMVSCYTLNVRSGPGTNYDKIGIVSQGAVLTGSLENGWLKFTYNNKTAYCSGDYLEKVKDDSNRLMVNCYALNVRSGPGTNYDKIGTLSEGTILTGSLENGWLKFTYNGKTAYCSAGYLKKVEGTSNQTTGTSKKMTVTCYALNVRSGPGTSYSTIGVLSGGMSVNVLDVLDGWYKIAFGNGVGYVSALYLS